MRRRQVSHNCSCALVVLQVLVRLPPAQCKCDAAMHSQAGQQVCLGLAAPELGLHLLQADSVRAWKRHKIVKDVTFRTQANPDTTRSVATAFICLVFLGIASCAMTLVMTHCGEMEGRRFARSTAQRNEQEPMLTSKGLPRMSSVPGTAPSNSNTLSSSTPSTSPAEKFATPLSDTPMIYPDLVMTVARAKLTIPIEPLNLPEFEIDILGVSGVHLLCATLAMRPGGARTLEICLSNAGTLLAVVTPDLQIYDGKGRLFGGLTKGQHGAYTFCDAKGKTAMDVVPGVEGVCEARLVCAKIAGNVEEHAVLFRRPRGILPADHYELVAAAGIDAVLALSCFMSIILFAQPRR